MMIAAGNAWLPSLGAAHGAGAEIFGAKLADAGQAEAEFRSVARRRKLACSKLSEKVTDWRRGS